MRCQCVATLTLVGAVWASGVHVRAGTEQTALCPERWSYETPATASYLSPLFVSDSAGDLFWWEHTGVAELVALRNGKTRWRRRLSTLARPGPFIVSATLMRDDLLAVSFESTLLGLRTSDGRTVWSRALAADLSPELARAGIPRNTELATGSAARVGRALVTAVAVGRSGAWLVATESNGKPVWRTRIAGAAARMVADGDRLYVLPSESGGDKPSLITVDGNGKEVTPTQPPFAVGVALRGDEVLFDQEDVVTAGIAPMAITCPPMSPSCRPPPLILTVTGLSAGQERWHLSHPVGLARVHLLLLSDGAVLFVENRQVGRISPDGQLTPLCELPVEEPRSVMGLVHGDLVVARVRGVGAYGLPGAPQLAATGWVMHGSGPAQNWAVRAPAATRAVDFPAGVADSIADVAYVQTDTGVTTALALADGKVKWRTQRPAKPVGIWRGRVVVLEADATGLGVAQLDAASGTEVATSRPIPLPYSLSSPLAPWGEPFWSDVRIEGDRARLSWEIMINGGPGGATIRPYGASGSADVDLASGAVTLSPTNFLEGPKPVRSPSGQLTAVVGHRRFTLLYIATAKLIASDARSGKELWSRQLWNVAPSGPQRLPPP